MALDRDKLIDVLRIDPETLKRFRRYEELLIQWSAVKNLVAPSAFAELWTRHILDSAQVQRALPEARVWVDLGSGGGFPGIVTAMMLADSSDGIVHLVESDGRKCAFLRAVSRETGLRTVVHHARIEDCIDELPKADAVSARALAAMDRLIAWSDPMLRKGAVGIFLKGKGVAAELTHLTRDSSLSIETRPSISQSDGAIVLVRRSDMSHGACP